MNKSKTRTNASARHGALKRRSDAIREVLGKGLAPVSEPEPDKPVNQKMGEKPSE